MSTAQEIVVDAFGLLTIIDINETGPSPVEMTKGLRALTQMIDAWGSQGLNVADQTVTGTVDGSTAVITGVSDTSKLAVGMNVTGTGVTGRIKSIDDLKKQITMEANTTIAGSSVSLLCAALPFQSKFEQGVAALLALRIALLVGEDKIPAYAAKMAQDGWHALCGNFMRAAPVTFDPALLQTSTRRTSVIAP